MQIGWLTRRRRPQFSLAALLAVVTAIGIALGWQVNRVARKREAVAAIAALRGRVLYDYQLDDDGLTERPDAPPPGPAWLRRVLGDDYFANVAHVVFDVSAPTDTGLLESPATDADLEVLCRLPSLTYLDVSSTKATATGVRHLQDALSGVLIVHRDHPMLGVALTFGQQQVQVKRVLISSGAFDAGIWVDDVIEAVDQKPIRDSRDLIYTVSRHWPGDRVVVRLRRGSETLERTVELRTINWR